MGSWEQLTNLLRKDLAVLVRRDRILVGLVFLLAHPMVFPSREAFFWLGISLALGLSVYVPTMEWHQETDRMLNSLPISRRAVVLARYCSSLIWIGFSAVAWLTAGWLLGPILDSSTDMAFGTSWMTPHGVMTYLIVAVVMTSLFLPLLFRFGLGRAVLSYLALGLITYGSASIRLGLFRPALRLEGTVAEWIQSVGTGWVLVGVMTFLAVLVAVSGTTSVSGFKRRDL